ncbi:MAG: tail fiber protein [Phascolarctobacterium sp.]|nr:tail fiber protein [Phascolarctobacterium sp.]
MKTTLVNNIFFRKCKGSGFLVIAVAVSFLVSAFAFGTTKFKQFSYSGISDMRTKIQAQQYAEAEAAVVKATAYSELAARSKAEIQNSNGYKSEITLSAESNYSAGIKQRIATVNIYKDNEILPCYQLEVLKTDAEASTSTAVVPVGTIVAWAVNTSPFSSDVWLECNGQSCSAYPELVAVLGKNTVPDFRNRFLEGHATPGTFIEAGLPNVTGKISNGNKSNDYVPTGPFYKLTNETNIMGKSKHSYPRVIVFDMSKASSVYGNSSTVQPPAMTVKFLIKAT